MWEGLLKRYPDDPPAPGPARSDRADARRPGALVTCSRDLPPPGHRPVPRPLRPALRGRGVIQGLREPPPAAGESAWTWCATACATRSCPATRALMAVVDGRREALLLARLPRPRARRSPPARERREAHQGRHRRGRPAPLRARPDRRQRGQHLGAPRGHVLYVTPAGVCKGFLTPEMIVRTDLEGRPQGGGRASTEILMHTAVYRRRADVRAVVHAHPPDRHRVRGGGHRPRPPAHRGGGGDAGRRCPSSPTASPRPTSWRDNVGRRHLRRARPAHGEPRGDHRRRRPLPGLGAHGDASSSSRGSRWSTRILGPGPPAPAERGRAAAWTSRTAPVIRRPSATRRRSRRGPGAGRRRGPSADGTVTLTRRELVRLIDGRRRALPARAAAGLDWELGAGHSACADREEHG